MDLLALSRSEVRELLPPIDAQIDLVEATYRAMARGDVELPPKPGIHPRTDAFIHAMPAYLRHSDVAAVKWVSGYPTNRARGLPYISGVIVVNDPETGLPTSIMDAAEITAARTAAASGVCVRHFAPPGWSRVAILGCGEQGRYHAAVARGLEPAAVMRAYDPVAERAHQLADRVEVARDPRQAVEGADIVVTAGPIVEDPEPVIAGDWLDEQALLLPIDFDFYLRREVVEQSSLFLVDDVDQFEYYRSAGHFEGWPKPAGSVGEALERGWAGDGRVVCVNLGVGALDAAFADVVLRQAKLSGVGARVALG
jgi:alanine dehydrogenase